MFLGDVRHQTICNLNMSVKFRWISASLLSPEDGEDPAVKCYRHNSKQWTKHTEHPYSMMYGILVKIFYDTFQDEIKLIIFVVKL
jgi:hypothetical protein